MTIAAYQLNRNALITSVGGEALVDLHSGTEPGHDYWVLADIQSAEEIGAILRQFNVHPLLLDDFLNPEHSTLIARYPEATYIELPTNAEPEKSTAAYLSIVCLPSVIVTMQRGEIPALPRLVTLLEGEERLGVGNTSNLLYRLIDYFIDGTINQGLVYRKQVSRLEELLQQEPEALDPNELAMLIRHSKQLENIGADQLYCTTSLVSHRHEDLDIEGQQVYFNDLVTDAEYALRFINRLSDRLKDLQSNLQLQHQDSTEKRLRILTVISAVFLPLTFITAFLGMNFVNMSLVYEWEYGVSFFSVVMIVLSSAMMWFFYRWGWFD